MRWRRQKDLHFHIRAFGAPALRVKLQRHRNNCFMDPAPGIEPRIFLPHKAVALTLSYTGINYFWSGTSKLHGHRSAPDRICSC
jgi:hypothetical protein